jgi:hypothetical protein
MRRSGIGFALAVVAVLAAWFGGNELYTRLVILPRAYPLLEPGAVNIVGVKLEGERIVVTNGVARLLQGSAGAFTRPEDDDPQGGTTIPIRALIGAMSGGSAAVSELATAFAGIKFDIEPDESLIWKAEDIRSALSADGEARARLEKDLCVALDGGPGSSIGWRRLQTGIWIETPFEVNLSSASGPRRVRGTVLQPYRARMAAKVESAISASLKGGRLAPDEAMIRGFYEQAFSDPHPKEDVAASLRSLISTDRARELASPVERLLARTTILVTERQVTAATMGKEPKPGGEGFVYSLSLDITGDSRDRLWQYTHKYPGCQLLLVSNSVAIAAPFVEHEIKYSKVTITNIADEELANDALTTISKSRKP